jgi:ACS family allantoate permease-like MFS transporter
MLTCLQGSSIFAGVISYGIGHTNTSIAPWRLLFLVLGGFSFIWAAVLWYFLPDSPVTWRFLSDREKYVCVDRIRLNNTGLEDKKVKWYQVRECLLDVKTWLLALFAVAQNIPNGGLVTFSSIIVSGLGYSKLATTLLGIPTGIIATTWQLIWSFILARYPHHRCATIAGINLFPLICAVLMWQLPRSNKHGLLAAYYGFYSYWGTCLANPNESEHTDASSQPRTSCQLPSPWPTHPAIRRN